MKDPIAKTRSVAVVPSRNEIARTLAMTHQAFTRAVRLSMVATAFWLGCPEAVRRRKNQVIKEDMTRRAKTPDSTRMNFAFGLM